MIVELFSNASCTFTPSQLHALAQERNVKVGLTTVYRLLEVLIKIGAATSFLIGGSIYYAYCDGSHHHHFVCVSCHQVLDIYDCPSFAKLPEGYRIQSHRVDLFGTCPECKSVAQEEHEH